MILDSILDQSLKPRSNSYQRQSQISIATSINDGTRFLQNVRATHNTYWHSNCVGGMYLCFALKLDKISTFTKSVQFNELIPIIKITKKIGFNEIT